MVGLMEISSRMAYATPRSGTQSPFPSRRSMLTCTSTGDIQTLKGRSGSVSVGSPDAYKVLFEPSEHLWWVWGLILNVISPLLPPCWGLSFALGHGVSFFGYIQHSPVDDCSAASCNFGVLTGEDECMSFYATILGQLGKLSSGHRTGKGQLHSNPKEMQCQKMFKQ